MNASLTKISGLILGIIGLILLPLFNNPYNIHLMIITGINAILAMTFILMLRTGLVSIAIAAFWGIGAYTSAILAIKGGLSFWLALPLSTLFTALIAFITGIFLVKNAGFSFVILTMAFGELAVLLFGNTPFIGGYDGLTNIPNPDPISLFGLTIEFADKLPNYYLMLLIFCFVALSYKALYSCWAGRAWQAIGLNIHLAESLGIDLYRYRIAVFTIACATAGLAGSFYVHYFQAIQPASFQSFKTIYVHIMAILGGIGSPVLGSIIGACVLTFLPETLRLAKEFEPIFTGIIIVLLILFLPDGIMSLFKKDHKHAGLKGNLIRMKAGFNRYILRNSKV